MRYELQFKPRAERDLANLPKNIAARILAKLETLRDGLQGDVKRLTNHAPEYSLRVGDYRVLFELDSTTILVYRVVHRKDAY